MNKKGFTLIEVLLVIVIIGIISVITIPNIMESLKESKKESGETTEELLEKNLELYNADNRITGFQYREFGDITVYDVESDLFGYDNSYDATHSCYKTVSYDDLLLMNQDIKLGSCFLKDSDSLMIERIVTPQSGNYVASYKYYAHIICGKNLSGSNGILTSSYSASDVHYESSDFPTTQKCSSSVLIR